MTRAKNMVFRQVNNIFFVVHNAAPPDDAEWDGYLEAVKQSDISKIRSLIFTAGGGPSGKQRAPMNALLHGRASLAAVMSDSSWVRMIVTALSWTNPRIQVFSFAEIDRAYQHLGLTSAEIIVAHREITTLRREIGV